MTDDKPLSEQEQKKFTEIADHEFHADLAAKTAHERNTRQVVSALLVVIGLHLGVIPIASIITMSWTPAVIGACTFVACVTFCLARFALTMPSPSKDQQR